MLAIAIALLAATAAAPEPAPAPAAVATPAPTKLRVLVLELRNTGGDVNVVKLVGEAVASQLAKNPGVEVLTLNEVKDALDLDAQKRALDCADDSCLAEVANALGAEYVVSGSVGKLSELTIVNLSMMDSKRGASVGRESVEARDAEQLLTATRAAADRLLGKLVPATALASAGTGVSSTFIVGAVVGGAGVVAAGVGGVVLAQALFVAGDRTLVASGGPDGDAKLAAVERVDPALAFTGAALVVGVAGVIVAALSMGDP